MASDSQASVSEAVVASRALPASVSEATIASHANYGATPDDANWQPPKWTYPGTYSATYGALNPVWEPVGIEVAKKLHFDEIVEGSQLGFQDLVMYNGIFRGLVIGATADEITP